MELHEFRVKLKELHKKSKMEDFCDWPFVYDEDEDGLIYVDSEGSFFFADANKEWVPSHLSLDNVVNMRYTVCYEEPGIDFPLACEYDDVEPDESYIYIHFTTGDCIELFNRHIDNGQIDVYVTVIENDENRETIDTLKSRCQMAGYFPTLSFRVKS